MGAEEGDPPFSISAEKEEVKIFFFYNEAMVLYPLIQKSYNPGPINRYIVKENNIGSAGSDILCYK